MLVIVQDEHDNVIRRFDADMVPRVGDSISLLDGGFEQKLFWRVKDVDWQLQNRTGLTLALVIVEPK